MKKENRYAEWLGFRTDVNIMSNRSIGALVSVLLTLLGIVLAVLFFGMLAMIFQAVFAWENLGNSDEVIRAASKCEKPLDWVRSSVDLRSFIECDFVTRTAPNPSTALLIRSVI